MWALVEYAARVNPQIVMFESVTAAYSKGRDLMRALRARLEELTGDEWRLYHVLHNASALGGPCVRRRYFWVASKVPFGVEHPQLPFVTTFGDAIGDLTEQPLSWSARPYTDPMGTRWSASRRATDDIVDGHMYLDKPIDRRLVEVLSTTRWDVGEDLETALRRSIAETGDVPPSWRNSPFLKNEDDNWRFGWSTERRWDPSKPGHVITGAGQYTTMHPTNPRPLTQREVARVMGFPDDWVIEPYKDLSNLNNTWGKGISVPCGEWIGTWARRSLEGKPGELCGARIGEREWEIQVKRPWLAGQPAPDELIYLTHATSRRRRSQTSEAGVQMSLIDPFTHPEVHRIMSEQIAEETTTTKRRYVRRDKAEVEANRQRVWQFLEAHPEGTKRHQIAEGLGVSEREVYEAIWFYLKLAEGAPLVHRDKRLWRTTTAAAAVPEDQPVAV